jgi:2,3-bisphosphoglycerate-independent phosphoglycerate mutase
VLRRLLEGRAPVAESAPFSGRHASLIGLDARLGVEGLPQSGTGQAALLTGQNAPKAFGRHFGPWVPAALRHLLRTQSVLAHARAAGRRVAFANAYPEEVIGGADARSTGDGPAPHRRRAAHFLNAGPPLAAAGADALFRSTEHLSRGEAVASEITNEGWRKHLGRSGLPRIEPAEAGRNLARIANTHDLTLFAHYATDQAGHTGRLDEAVAAIERVDAFLGGLIESVGPDATVNVASDHGNLEDRSAGHTRNPAFALAAGADHADVARTWSTLLDVAPAIRSRLS